MELKQEFAVRVWEKDGEKVVEIVNLRDLNRKVSLAGKLADELLNTYSGFYNVLKSRGEA